jgi:ketosteroid isomerase-like protein
MLLVSPLHRIATILATRAGRPGPLEEGMTRAPILVVACVCAAACTTPGKRPPPADLREQVAATERAFAKTMAERDHAAFTSFLSVETVFLPRSGALRGKDSVAAAWKRYYERPEAPFSWEPDTVEVLDSGTLALSTGPVHDPTGKLVGRFSSIWRLEAPGAWRIVFDHGCDVCEATKP